MKLRVRNFMNELGFRPAGDMAFGIVDGYLVSIDESNGTSSLFVDINLNALADVEREKIHAFIQNNAGQYSILRAEVENTGVLVLFDGSASGFAKLRDFLFFFTQHLNALKIPGASVCSNCGRPIASIAVVCINGRLHTCDKDCAARLEQGAAKVRPEKTHSNLLSGLVGALLGGIIAAVPYVFLSYTGIFSLWYGVVIALLVKGGFELFGGKPSVGKGIAVPLICLLSAAASVFSSYCFMLTRRWAAAGYAIGLREIAGRIFGDLLSGSELQLQIMKEAGILFGFAVLGILLLMRLSKKTTSRRVYVVS